jgi:hypothetical protein
MFPLVRVAGTEGLLAEGRVMMGVQTGTGSSRAQSWTGIEADLVERTRMALRPWASIQRISLS